MTPNSASPESLDGFVALPRRPTIEHDEMLRRSGALFQSLDRRRSVRQFSDRSVDRAVIENCIRAAGTAPSGANQQPWRFVVVEDSEVKHRIRLAAEEEERRFYGDRAPEEWLAALEPLGTNEHKPFLDIAPFLIVVMAVNYGMDERGARRKHYYVSESVGIASGMLITAIHEAGLACLTHTPSPMGFLADLLGRPENERPFLLIPVGHPADDAVVPDIRRKDLAEICTFV